MNKQKYIFRSHPVLVVGGRFLTLSFLIFPFFLTFVAFKFIINAYVIIDIIISFPLCFWLTYCFWQNCWGKLIMTEEVIIWRCLFQKSVYIHVSEIKILTVMAFKEKNVYSDMKLYKNSHKYILISSGKLPNKRIDKIHCGKGIIKMQYSDRLWKYLCECKRNKLSS